MSLHIVPVVYPIPQFSAPPYKTQAGSPRRQEECLPGATTSVFRYLPAAAGRNIVFPFPFCAATGNPCPYKNSDFSGNSTEEQEIPLPLQFQIFRKYIHLSPFCSILHSHILYKNHTPVHIFETKQPAVYPLLQMKPAGSAECPRNFP